MILQLLVCYLAVVNIITAYMFWLDWRHARAGIGVPIPESIFLTLSIAGGAAGIVTLQILTHHRMYRRNARRKYLMAMAIQFSAIIYSAQGMMVPLSS